MNAGAEDWDCGLGLRDIVVHACSVRYMAVLHGALHGRLCMLMLQMMMPHKGCIDVTML